MKSFKVNGMKFVRYFDDGYWVLFVPRTGEHLHHSMLWFLRITAHVYSEAYRGDK